MEDAEAEAVLLVLGAKLQWEPVPEWPGLWRSQEVGQWLYFIRDHAGFSAYRALAALYLSGGETDKAARQSEMADMLLQHPKEAGAGISALNRAMTMSGQIDKDIRK